MEEVLEASTSENLKNVDKQLSTDRRGFMTGRWDAKPEYDQASAKPRALFLSSLMTFSVFAGTVAFSGTFTRDKEIAGIDFENYEGLTIDKAVLSKDTYYEELENLWGRAEYEIPSEGEYTLEVTDNQQNYEGEVCLKAGEDITVDLENF